MTEQRNARRTVVGVVVSTKMQKTISVEVDRLTMHPKYKKFVKRSSRYYAHDEKTEAALGDVVEVMECRPISKQKKFRLVRIIRRGKGAASRAAAGGDQ